MTCAPACSSVDAFHRLHFLGSGETTQIAGVRVGPIGGAPESEDTRDEILGRNVSKRAVNRLRKHEFDVLLTRGFAQGSGGESNRWGSKLIRELIEAKQPAIHEWAHHTDPISPAEIRATTSVGCMIRSFRRPKMEDIRDQWNPVAWRCSAGRIPLASNWT